MSGVSDKDMVSAKRVLRYLKSRLDLKIIFRKGEFTKSALRCKLLPIELEVEVSDRLRHHARTRNYQSRDQEIGRNSMQYNKIRTSRN